MSENLANMLRYKVVRVTVWRRRLLPAWLGPALTPEWTNRKLECPGQRRERGHGDIKRVILSYLLTHHIQCSTYVSAYTTAFTQQKIWNSYWRIHWQNCEKGGLEDPVLGRKGTWLVAYTRILMKTTKRVWWSHYLLVSKSILFTIVRSLVEMKWIKLYLLGRLDQKSD